MSVLRELHGSEPLLTDMVRLLKLFLQYLGVEYCNNILFPILCHLIPFNHPLTLMHANMKAVSAGYTQH